MMRRGVVLTVIGGALLTGACGPNGTSDCTEAREAVDPASFTHVIDPESVTYQSYPPTSGPHVALPTPSGALDAPVPAAVQVRILESGGVLIQYEAIDESDAAELEGLAGPNVVVAPGVDLPTSVVATAWTWKLTCGDAGVGALTDFIARRRSAAPGLD